MTRAELHALLGDVRSGALTPEAAQDRLLQFLRQAPVRRPGVRARRPSPRAAPGVPGSHFWAWKDARSDCRHRRAHRRRGPQPARDPHGSPGVRRRVGARHQGKIPRAGQNHYARARRAATRPRHDRRRRRRHGRPAGGGRSGGLGRADGQRGRSALRRRRRRHFTGCSPSTPASSPRASSSSSPGWKARCRASIGGLVSVPVIAVPTSVGYGASFGGLTALLAMLNSCASGVSVVNIDNGFGAAAVASAINHLELGSARLTAQESLRVRGRGFRA